MQRFTYEVMDFQGHRIIDSGEARSKDDLLISLQSQGLVLLRWVDEAHSRPSLFKRSTRTLKTRDLLQITKELAYLMKSSLPIDRALAILASSAAEESVRTTAEYLKESLRGGSSLSEAMATRSEDFSNLYVNMVRVGEMGGILPQVMKKLAQFMERTEEIKRFIISSSIYPAILLLVGILSVLVIMGFVIPSFAGIFNDLGQEIPFTTQVLIQVSNFLRAWWWLILTGTALFFTLLWRIANTPFGKNSIDRLLIKTPGFGTLLVDVQVSRFARTLGTLVQSGVPLLKALSIVQDVVENNVVKSAVGSIYHQVKEGKRISTLMKNNGIFPAMAVQMVSLGEETGKIGEMLIVVADDLDNKIQVRIKSLLSLLEPLAILMMGLIIGGVVVSMLSAIFGINEIEF